MRKITLIAAAIVGLGLTVASAEVNLAACKGCHGKSFEKKALGKSKIVADMTKEDIEKAMVGYKEGNYGGPMKGIMKGQVAKYSNEELNASAEVMLKLAGK